MPLRWRIQPCLTSSPRLCRTKRRFCLVTCQRFTIFIKGKWAPPVCNTVIFYTSVFCAFNNLKTNAVLQNLSEGVGALHRLPRVSGKMLFGEGKWNKKWSECIKEQYFFLSYTFYSVFLFFYFLRWLTCRSMRSTVTINLGLRASGGSVQTAPSSR